MLNEEYILTALNDVKDSYVEEARKALGYGAARKRRRNAWKTLLLAAVIASLLGVSAYATGWFGLSSRLTPAKSPYNENNAVMSMNDYAGTPAAEAHREWWEFYFDYSATLTLSNEDSFSSKLEEPEKSYSMIYGAYDRRMLDKLYEIRDEYGVTLHEKRAHKESYEESLNALGITDFIRGDADRSVKYFYEDGSFSAEGWMQLDGARSIYTLVRGVKGVLDPAGLSMSNWEVYDEWQYKTSAGMTVNIALNKWNDLTSTVPVLVFCDTEDFIITVMGECANTENIRESAESFAERFDYAALTGGKVDPTAFDKPEAAKPTAVKPKAGLMSVKAFFGTDEYKASTEFQRGYAERQDELDVDNVFKHGQYQNRYYGAFPAGDEAVNKILEDVSAKYPELVIPHEALGVWCGIPVEAAQLTGPNSYRPPEGAPIASFVYERMNGEEYAQLLGLEKFTGEDEYTVSVFDTGAFYISDLHDFTALHYIPKGTFYPLLRFALDEDGEAWTYESACGEQVSMAFGGTLTYPIFAHNYALYETDTAYVLLEFEEQMDAEKMEATVDRIDFTMFNSVKPFDESRAVTPRAIEYAPLTIMQSNWFVRDEFVMAFSEKEATFYTFANRSGGDTSGITWSLTGSDKVTLTDNGDGSCTITSSGTEKEVVKLTAMRGSESCSAVVVCYNDIANMRG